MIFLIDEHITTEISYKYEYEQAKDLLRECKEYILTERAKKISEKVYYIKE